MFDDVVRKLNLAQGKINVTSMLSEGKEKGAGRKKHKATQKWKGPANCVNPHTRLIVDTESESEQNEEQLRP